MNQRRTITTLTNADGEKLLTFLRTQGNTHTAGMRSIRNEAIALLMYDAGLRVGEVCQLLQTDLVVNGEPVTAICIRAEIAKRKIERTVPTTARIKEVICELKEEVWLNDHNEMQMYAFYLLTSRTPISRRQVQRIIKRAAIASIGQPIHPHALRHSFASRLMRRTSMRVVQDLLGHKNIASTQIYTHPDSKDRHDAIAALEK